MADALSRVELEVEQPQNATLWAFSIQTNDLMEEVRTEQSKHPVAEAMREKTHGR